MVEKNSRRNDVDSLNSFRCKNDKTFCQVTKINDRSHTVLKSRLSLCRTFFLLCCDAMEDEKCINREELREERAFASSSVKKILKTFVMAHFFTHLENKLGDE